MSSQTQCSEQWYRCYRPPPGVAVHQPLRHRPPHLGGVVELLLLGPAVELVQHGSVRRLGPRRLALPGGPAAAAATAGLHRLQLGQQTPV